MVPLVSILIPAYNAQNWIARTIQSALDQSWPRKEIVVVDDGSTDGTLEVARQFASSEVIVATQANQGAATARNKAFELSHGDYIQWLDADDLLSPDKIARQMAVLSRCNGRRSVVSSEWAYFFHRTAKAQFNPTLLWCDLSPKEWLFRKLDQNLFMQTATWLVTRELTEAAGPWDKRLLGDDDGEYFCRVLMASDEVIFVPQARVFYRIAGSGSLSYIGRSERKLRAHLLSMEMHVRYMRTLEDSERIRLACLKYLERQLPHFYPERPDLVQKIDELAATLGVSHLTPPRMSWKYDWIRRVFGWTAAKGVQRIYNRYKCSILAGWDKMLARFDKQSACES
jgi:glycosyltransferase involved in cell wall biosynthesis